MRYKPLLISVVDFLIEEEGKRAIFCPLMWARAGWLFPSFGPLVPLCMHITIVDQTSRGGKARRGVAFSLPSAISHCVAANRVDMVAICWRVEAQGGRGYYGKQVRARQI